jgi:hypothetical protein
LARPSKVSYISSSSNRIQQGSNTAGIYLGLLRNPTDFDISDYIGTYFWRSGNPTQWDIEAIEGILGDTANLLIQSADD